jgi:Uma2 family endonuclease
MSSVPDRVPEGLIKLTYEDYADLPNDGKRYEVLDGELVMTPAPTTAHQAVSRDLLIILHMHVAARGQGAVYDAPIDVILAPTTVVQPDLVFVAAPAPRSSRSGRSRAHRTCWSRSCRRRPCGRIA